MFTVITDVLKGIGLLFQLLWEETATFAEPYWRALKNFLLYGTLVPFILFVLGFILRSTVLLTLGGIFLCMAFVLVTLAFTPLIALVGRFLKKDDQAGSRFIKTILSIWLWELLTVFYCVVFPVWNDYRSLLLVALCTLILSLASVVWGVGYITWFRKVLVVLVALVFVFCTFSFFLPATATTLRKMLPNFDQYLNRLLSTKRATGELTIADINRDGYLDSLDVMWLKRFVADPGQIPDSTRGDVNGDGKIDPVDVKYLEDYLYNGGWPPRPPKPKPVPVERNKTVAPPLTTNIRNTRKLPDVRTYATYLPAVDSTSVAVPNQFCGQMVSAIGAGRVGYGGDRYSPGPIGDASLIAGGDSKYPSCNHLEVLISFDSGHHYQRLAWIALRDGSDSCVIQIPEGMNAPPLLQVRDSYYADNNGGYNLRLSTVSDHPSMFNLEVPSTSEEGIEVPMASGEVIIEVSGTVDIGRGRVGSEGEPGYCDISIDSYPYNASLKDHVGGCEIIVGGRLEDGHLIGGTRFLVGRSWEGNLTGPARLRVIESRQGYHDGNVGSFSATIHSE